MASQDDQLLQANEPNGFENARRRTGRLRPARSGESRRAETHSDRCVAGRPVDPQPRAGIIERVETIVTPAHEEDNVAAGRWKRGAGHADNFEGAKSSPAVDRFVHGSPWNEDFALPKPARVVGVKQAIGDPNAIGREHQPRRRIFDTKVDRPTVGE